jgi:hypothetical protein
LKAGRQSNSQAKHGEAPKYRPWSNSPSLGQFPIQFIVLQHTLVKGLQDLAARSATLFAFDVFAQGFVDERLQLAAFGFGQIPQGTQKPRIGLGGEFNFLGIDGHGDLLVAFIIIANYEISRNSLMGY